MGGGKRAAESGRKSVLLTAFAPYGRYRTNASALCLERLNSEDWPDNVDVMTRIYPVDFAAVRRLLEDDLTAGFDYSLHLGQAPGEAAIQLESIGINVQGPPEISPELYKPLEATGPAAYRCPLPLSDWADRLRAAGIAVAVSFHGGTYLCNAALYWSHFLAERDGLQTQSAFVHLPLEDSQFACAMNEPEPVDEEAYGSVGAARNLTDLPSMPVTQTAAAIRTILCALGESAD